MPLGWEPVAILIGVMLSPLVLRLVDMLGSRLERWVLSSRFADEYRRERGR